MANDVKISRTRGGDLHPLSVRNFVLDHLVSGKDYSISDMHRAYKAELDRIAEDRGRRQSYHKPTYNSFSLKVRELIREGILEPSGREETSRRPQFAALDNKPVRRYYRKVR